VASTPQATALCAVVSGAACVICGRFGGDGAHR